MAYERVPLDSFHQAFSHLTELSSVALGGQVESVSDDFFAEAFHLLLVEPAASLKGQFGPNGALFSGWESRRHNPTYDWCIIRLGTSGTIVGFDVDTSHFNGNEAPEVSVAILDVPGALEQAPQMDDSRWKEILPKVGLGPNSRHLFKIEESSSTRYVKLNMYPDGGIARFRVYGQVTPVLPVNKSESFDLAHVFAGGRVLITSDQHFGVGSNLILPGRGKDMGDGWETKRSRVQGHKDFVIVKLGVPGYLEQAEIDTAHFKGNFPESCELHATLAEEDTEPSEAEWTEILPRTKLGPHRQHYFRLENVKGKAYSHVRMTIYPDGGIKRLRLIGKVEDIAGGVSVPCQVSDIVDAPTVVNESSADSSTMTLIPTLPLTPEAFAPFGQVIQAYEENAAPRGTKITPANDGSATKFHKLALVASSYPEGSGETTGFSVYRCQPVKIVNGGRVPIGVLERHPYTNQAFVPMGSREGLRYLVVVAKTDSDDKPLLSSLQAFIADGSQGIVYNTATWHQPMTVLNQVIDFTCVETQMGGGQQADCEIVRIEQSQGSFAADVSSCLHLL